MWTNVCCLLEGSLLILVLVNLIVIGTGDDTSPEERPPPISGKANISQIDMYRRILQSKRSMQKEALKNIVSMEDYSKQYKMVKTMVESMSSVLVKAQVLIMESGFLPGDSFPEEETLRNAFSNVVENTAFFGDILMRLPDITHDILRRHHEWEKSIVWAVGFCRESDIFTGADAVLLHLMSQEMGVIEKDKDYVNPYKLENKLKSDVEKVVDEVLASKLKKKEKKKREKRRGPRMSNAHVEL